MTIGNTLCTFLLYLISTSVVYICCNNSRDEAVAKIKILRERDSKESKQHVTEVKEFQRVLHHDRKVHNFLHDKNQGRAVIEEDDERRCEIF